MVTLASWLVRSRKARLVSPAQADVVLIVGRLMLYELYRCTHLEARVQALNPWMVHTAR